MYRDLFGNPRLKINLHLHTTCSDGNASPEEAARFYREAGYDAIALTDHWVPGKEQTLSGLPILSGCEYDVGSDPSTDPIFHIIGIGFTTEPAIERGMRPNAMIHAIHAAGGYAILAHPEWSLETVEQIMAEDGASMADGAEIYNTVSDFGMSYRADSSAILDRVAIAGRAFPLHAADDTHYYTGDQCRSYLMVQTDEPTREKILSALREGQFYATQGPEIHAWIEGDRVFVRTSPVKRINFHTSLAWCEGAVARGYGITEASFALPSNAVFVRVSAQDEDGRQAWTSFLPIPNRE